MNTAFGTKSPFLSSALHLVTPSTMTLAEPVSATTTLSAKRCNAADCKRKLLLSDFDCKCAIRFCPQHRVPESHGCTFNFRAAADTTLAKQLGKATDNRLSDKI